MLRFKTFHFYKRFVRVLNNIKTLFHTKKYGAYYNNIYPHFTILIGPRSVLTSICLKTFL